jgi:hypothetical protein
MKRSNVSPPPAIVVRPHPPERLVRALARGEVAACCSCCSSCCCLHSLGSLAGAIAGSFDRADPPDPGGKGKGVPPAGLRDDELDGPVAGAPAKPGSAPVAATIFWWSAAALAVLTIVASPMIWDPTIPVLGIGVLIFFLPGVLLGGAVVSALVIASTPTLRGNPGEWKRLGWITLGIVAGALIGGILMVPLFHR